MPIAALPLAVVNMACMLLVTSRSLSGGSAVTDIFSDTPFARAISAEALQAAGESLHMASLVVSFTILALSATEQESHRQVLLE